MNILFGTLYPPNPPVDGGRLRTMNILKQVAARHSVTLVCFEDPLSGPGHRATLRDLCEQIVIVPKVDERRRSWVNKLADSASREPIGLNRWQSFQMRAALDRLLQEKKFDIVHIDHIVLAQYAEALGSIPRVLAYHNIESIAQRREMTFSNNGSPLRRAAGILENRRWEWYEIEAGRRSQAVVAVSEVEADYLRLRIPKVPVVVVPNGVDTTLFHPPHSRCDKPNLLFTGRMDYSPNVDAVVWFCREILPRIRHEYAEVTLTIVGRDPSAAVKALKDLPGVTVTGTVKDTRPFYSSAGVYVAPLRFGGGTRLKILEAMAMGMAVVSTHLGSEGLGLASGREIVEVDAPAGFAQAVLRLLRDPALRASLGERGRKEAESRFDWTVIGSAQEAAYEEGLSRRS